MGIINDHVPREALTKSMKLAVKHIYLTAPGGYGKTVATAQWLSMLRGKTECITMRDTDNDPSVFYFRLSQAIADLAGKGFEHTTLDGLLEAVRLLPKRYPLSYLVIDDLHMLTNDAISCSLPQLIARLPDYFRLCLISRAEPDAALLEDGSFTVFTQDDLRFNDNEVSWLGYEKGHDLSDEQIIALQEMTGGWAMYLSVLLSGKGYGETPHSLFEYLKNRVWAHWKTEMKQILMSLAVPAEVTPGLAELLTGQPNGEELLTRLEKTENAFLSRAGNDTYRFHDIFRDFLLQRMNEHYSEEEISRLNELTAEWYYERGDYFMSMRYFFKNRCHEGIARCERASSQYHAKTENTSVEATCNFVNLYILSLPVSFVMENHYLVVECSYVAYLDGDTDQFLYFKDELVRRMPEIAQQHPDLVVTAGFLSSLDFRMPMLEYAKRLAVMMPLMQPDETETVYSNTVTQNLPFFHRSMRDFSEVYKLKEKDLALFRNTFGVMIGDDYEVMEQSLIAGLLYEQGDLVNAAYHAISGVRTCGDNNHPETLFCANMILSAILYAMGALAEAGKIMERTGEYIEEKAQYLRQNFKALQTERIIRGGNTGAAGEWLDVFACPSGELPFYQICRHFTTMRSLSAIGEHETAVEFGSRLNILSNEYKRPLDQIESWILTAIALWRINKQEDAADLLREAVVIAMPYGFTQLFFNEGKEVLPLLWKLRERDDNPDGVTAFIDKLTEGICEKHGLIRGEMPQLSAQQRAMLPYLSKGMSYREIAEATGIGYDTVKSHVRLAYKRFGVHNAQEAVMKAKALGLL